MGKKKGYSYSRNLKKRRQKEKARIKIKNPIIDSAWKHGQSMKANFTRLGIAYDPNEVLKISSRAFFKGELTKIPRIHKQTTVVEALEEAAKRSKKKPMYFSDDDGLFCVYNIETHGDNYVEMAKDSKNAYQLTPKQLKRLIEKFKKTPFYTQYTEQKRSGTFDLTALYNTPIA
ncbi:unnamed protein product [Echinostoma caproni]|uniref:Nucleolar protein 16 n=1 Tax=Echinostoma caproni TaxID=27848 RepID=A0A183B429_9TREM|nr:unnamed protein product [Echinostoma caproni]